MTVQAAGTGRGTEGVTELDWRPWIVLDVDVAQPLDGQLAVARSSHGWGGAWILLRVFEEPVGSVQVTLGGVELTSRAVVGSIPEATAELIRTRLRDVGVSADGSNRGLPTEGCEPAVIPRYLARRNAIMEEGPAITAVVCTRDQPQGLARCLASLEVQSFRRAELLVVDNASTTDAARTVVRSTAGPLPIRYVYESRPGLSQARNRSLAEVSTELIAWIDDDEIADAHWLCDLVGGFMGHPEVSAVCGAMIPAELTTRPQYWFEEYGGHNKGRGFAPAVFSPTTRRQQSPLFPLPPFGTGGNMAMRVSTIRGLGGFDTSLGAGTGTMGGEDTRALTDILLANGTVVYRPTALTRHYHRRDYEGFRKQFHGYGAGLSGYYASLLIDRPSLILPMVRLMPQALRELRDPNGARLAGISEQFPADVLRAHRRGLFHGPFAYVRERLRRRRSAWSSSLHPMVAAGEG